MEGIFFNRQISGFLRKVTFQTSFLLEKKLLSHSLFEIYDNCINPQNQDSLIIRGLFRICEFTQFKKKGGGGFETHFFSLIEKKFEMSFFLKSSIFLDLKKSHPPTTSLFFET